MGVGEFAHRPLGDRSQEANGGNGPILEATDRSLGWNSGRMHHIDPLDSPDRRVCAVNGNFELGRRTFSR